MIMQAVTYPLTIFYDASCPLCRKEMHALKAYDAQDRLRLVDCSAATFRDASAEQAHITTADMLRLIHARDESGRWVIGVDVFVLAYRATGIEAVASLFEFRPLRPFLNRLYPWIARNRMVLSRFGVNIVYENIVRRAALHAQKRAQSCAIDQG
jgi:predicted DCC family thiol-disulfide oxidoreductase YuxK